MRIIEAIRLLTPILAVFAAALAASIRRIESQLRTGGAISEDRAIVVPRQRRVVRLAGRRLASAGAIRCLPDGRCYIDEAGWQRWRRMRRRRVLVAAATVLVVCGLLWVAGIDS